MGITQTTKKELLCEIEQLSNSYIIELQNFIQYLKFKQSSTAILTSNRRILPPEKDPILRAIGLCDVTPFSDAIDDTLYGAV